MTNIQNRKNQKSVEGYCFFTPVYALPLEFWWNILKMNKISIINYRDVFQKVANVFKIFHFSYLRPFPGDSANMVVLAEQRLVCCWEKRVFKQTTILLALPSQCWERLALIRNHHPPAESENTNGFLVPLFNHLCYLCFFILHCIPQNTKNNYALELNF